jgi:hypothetical protein
VLSFAPCRFRPPALVLVVALTLGAGAAFPAIAESPSPAFGLYGSLPASMGLTGAQRRALQTIDDDARARLETARRGMHAEAIARLSPEHRALLSNLAGYLALGSIGDEAAAKALDAALVAQEKIGLALIVESFAKQRSDALRDALAGYASVLTPAQLARLPAPPPAPRRDSTVGMALLRLALARR